MGTAADPRTAQSLYRGLRVTVTQLPDDGACLVSVATKAEKARWDEWNLLYPAIRIEARTFDSHEAVLEALQTVIGDLLRRG